MATVVVHLAAADGAAFDLTVVLPPIRSGTATVRVSSVQAFTVGVVRKRVAGQWVTQP